MRESERDYFHYRTDCFTPEANEKEVTLWGDLRVPSIPDRKTRLLLLSFVFDELSQKGRTMLSASAAWKPLMRSHLDASVLKRAFQLTLRPIFLVPLVLKQRFSSSQGSESPEIILIF